MGSPQYTSMMNIVELDKVVLHTKGVLELPMMNRNTGNMKKIQIVYTQWARATNQKLKETASYGNN